MLKIIYCQIPCSHWTMHTLSVYSNCSMKNQDNSSDYYLSRIMMKGRGLGDYPCCKNWFTLLQELCLFKLTLSISHVICQCLNECMHDRISILVFWAWARSSDLSFLKNILVKFNFLENLQKYYYFLYQNMLHPQPKFAIHSPQIYYTLSAKIFPLRWWIFNCPWKPCSC